MSSLLASDDANPEFTGAHDPDRRLPVRFYEGAMKNEFASAEQGRPIFLPIDMVEIIVDKNNVIDTFAREDHKARWPLHWARYQNNKSADTQTIGTPLGEWPLVSKAMAEELRAAKFYTVDQIAAASDQQIGRIGMAAGMAPLAFRDRAKRFLETATSEASVNQHAQEMAALKADNERIQREAAERDEKNAQAMAKLQEQMASLIENMPKKPGRKAKVLENA